MAENSNIEWRPIETAPKDGTVIQAEIPGNGSDNLIRMQGGFMSEDGEECSCWVFATEQEPPECWTDGVCWASNADEVESMPPTRWKYPPQAVEGE